MLAEYRSIAFRQGKQFPLLSKPLDESETHRTNRVASYYQQHSRTTDRPGLLGFQHPFRSYAACETVLYSRLLCPAFAFHISLGAWLFLVLC